MKDTGGYAFPSERANCQGMPLRDYYKGETIKGLLSNPNLISMDDMVNIATKVKGGMYLVNASANLADAMIAERGKNETN